MGKFVEIMEIKNGTATINHHLNTKDLIVAVYDGGIGGELIKQDAYILTIREENSITVIFNGAVGSITRKFVIFS